MDPQIRKALITGGSHGIGLAIAESMANEGFSVAICGRNLDRLNQAKQKLENYGIEVIAGQCDVTEPSSILEFWSVIEREWAGVDILINNVGGGGRWGKESPSETSPQVWSEVYQKNVGAAIQFTMLALPGMVKAEWGRVITITSIFGATIGGRPWFNIAKVAQAILMKSLAQSSEYSRKGITFNSVAPGSINIPNTGWSKIEKEQPTEFQEFLKKLPLGRLGTPVEVSDLVQFLCSDKAAYINGSQIVIDGGESHSIY